MGIKNTLKKNMDPEVFAASMSRLGVSIQTTFNPNHRHDEKWEQEHDRIRQEICDSHRYKSFARVRSNNAVKWYSDGHDYFWALSEILEAAKECIFIMDWWLSPELYLRRPPHHFEAYRVDRLLRRKAEEGVQIRIIVYKEVTQTMTLSSSHTKHHFEGLHDNIKVFRHPDHLGGEQTYFWSHHNKVVCVDNEFACVGGLDICYGRWDTQSHPLADVHPNHMLERTLFPGQDYNNARIQDFQQVDDFMSNQQSSLLVGRMPWHDVHVSFRGEAALDIAHLFAERWNFIKELKYRGSSEYSHIAFPHGAPKLDEVDPHHDAIARHPNTERFHEYGQKFRHPFHREHRELQAPDPEAANAGVMDVQVVRSCGDWSNGTLTEHSIQNAYIEMIREANHCIYIENQFFITATVDKTPVVNLIGAALVERILSAAKDKRRFKIVVIIPTIPCFAGELQEAAGIRCIMNWQYKSINRGKGNSIFEQCQAAGVDASEYISFYNLRGIDRINTSRVEEMEKASGVSFHQAQVAAARVYLGEQGYVSGKSKVAIRAAKETTEQATKAKDKKDKGQAETIEEVDLPASIEDAMAILKKFQSAVPEADEHVKDSIASNVLHNQPAIKDEPWPSTDEKEELNAYVTEEVYVHSKLMIVDDRKVIIGSANLNDRSQKGDGDSETAVVIDGKDFFDSKMDGEKYMASKFAASFRRHLWRQHLGLIAPQECNDQTASTYPTDAMKAAPFGNPDPEMMAKENEWERMVEDPLSEDVEKMWKGQAKMNTKIADEIFQVVPSDEVRTWKHYDEFFTARGPRTGHVASECRRYHCHREWRADQGDVLTDRFMPLKHVKERLSEWRGCLVEMPLHFLEDEDLDKGSRGVEVNNVTLPICKSSCSPAT